MALRIALTPAQLRAIESGDLQPFYSPKYYDQAARRYAQALGLVLPELDTPEQLSLLAEPDVVESAVALPAVSAGTLAPPVTSGTLADTSTSVTALATGPASPNPISDETPESLTRAATTVTHSAPSVGVTPPERSILSPKILLGAAALVVIAMGVSKVSTHKTSMNPLAVVLPPPPITLPVPTETASTTEAPPLTQSQATAPSPATAAQTPAAPRPAPPPPASAPLAAAPPPSAPRPAPPPAAAQKVPQSERPDSHLEAKASTWVQIVHADGSKTNRRVEPGERVEFNQRTTAAVAFGKPTQILLSIAGKAVDTQPFILQTSPARALVIMSQLKGSSLTVE